MAETAPAPSMETASALPPVKAPASTAEKGPSVQIARMPEIVDTPTFTCEVCKISVRSAQKLMDHVNFSPLHQASLGLGQRAAEARRASEGAKAKAHVRHLLYDGSKLFWRVNETLELCIYEDVTANVVTIRAFPQQKQKQKDPSSQGSEPSQSSPQSTFDGIPPVEVDLRRLRQALGLDPPPKAPGRPGKMMVHPPTRLAPTAGVSPKAKAEVKVAVPSSSSATASGSPAATDSSGEQIAKYLLARLQARRDPQGNILLGLHKLHEGEVDPTRLLLAPSDGPSTAVVVGAIPTDLAMRRRHTIDDVKLAQKEVSVAAARLKTARIKAQELSDLARKTMDAFLQTSKDAHHGLHGGRITARQQAEASTLASSASRAILEAGAGRRHSTVDSKPVSAWLRAYDKVALQNAVERSKEVLTHYPKYLENQTGTIESPH